MPENGPKQAAECEIGTFIRRVLVPTDFSETAQSALAYAVTLTSRCEASLHVLHVLEAIVGAEPLALQMSARGELERAIAESAWDDLRRQLPDSEQARLHVRLALQWGLPVMEILRYANEHKIDLITMGRHGQGGLKHLLMGHVAEGVVRGAGCAVLSVSHPATALMAGEGQSRSLPRAFGH